MSKTITILCACLLSLGVAITIGAAHERTAAGQVALSAAPQAQATVDSVARSAAGMFAPVKASSTSEDSVLESQDAVSCSAGGWQMVVRGWGSNCCGSTQKWLRFSGATPVFKCCGVCATGA